MGAVYVITRLGKGLQQPVENGGEKYIFLGKMFMDLYVRVELTQNETLWAGSPGESISAEYHPLEN